jgi:hypothetical protein
MSKIVPPTSARQPPTIEAFAVGSKTLKVTTYETQDTYTIFVGGHELYCIECMIYKPESSFARIIPTNIARLVQIYYNLNCSLEGNFQRGLDTTRIFQTLCELIRKKYKHIDTVSLTDASFRTCDNGHDVDLAVMTYLRTGKTWYEKNYGAYLDQSDVPKFNTMEQRMHQLKEIMTWNEFKQFIKGVFLITEKEMQMMFETAATWQDFFGPLSDKMGISDFCIFVSPWLGSFWDLSKHSFSSGTYYIPLKNIPTIEYKPVEYKRGGRRFTAKRLRVHKKRNYQ